MLNPTDQAIRLAQVLLQDVTVIRCAHVCGVIARLSLGLPDIMRHVDPVTLFDELCRRYEI